MIDGANTAYFPVYHVLEGGIEGEAPPPPRREIFGIASIATSRIKNCEIK